MGSRGVRSWFPGALAQARAAFEDRKSERYAQMAPIVSRLSAALARDGGFADDNRIVDVAIALEQMYDLPEQKISRTLRDRVSGFLGTDTASRERLKEIVKEFYDARSNIVHSQLGQRVSAEKIRRRSAKDSTSPEGHCLNCCTKADRKIGTS